MKKTSKSRSKDEHGNIKVQTWENARPRIKNKELQVEYQEMKKRSRSNSIKPSKAPTIVRELRQQDQKNEHGDIKIQS